MKKIFTLALITVFVFNSVRAQESFQKNKTYKTWVTLNSQPFKAKGILLEINDSTNKVSNSIVIQKIPKDKFNTTMYDVNDIETIQARRKNSVGKGILLGAASGFVIGGLSGLVVANGGAGSKTALSVGMPMALVGSGMGALAGSFKITIPIFGSNKNYEKNKVQLRELALK